MQVKLISHTPDPEKIIAYCARVSSPKQDNPSYENLLKYLVKHKHWSPFEQASMTVEIVTSRAISAQILRHRSFCAQEFSQRYSEAQQFEMYGARRQDVKNRQNSIDDLSEDTQQWFDEAQQKVITLANELYAEALKKGVAKECARFLLPLSTQSKLYVSGNIRSWIHYLQVRCNEDTQLEHREIALAIRDTILKEVCPTVYSVCFGETSAT